MVSAGTRPSALFSRKIKSEACLLYCSILRPCALPCSESSLANAPSPLSYAARDYVAKETVSIQLYCRLQERNLGELKESYSFEARTTQFGLLSSGISESIIFRFDIRVLFVIEGCIEGHHCQHLRHDTSAGNPDSPPCPKTANACDMITTR